MKTITYLFLLVPTLTFAQSKKELNAEIQRLQLKTDSISKETEKRIQEIDSLKTLLKGKDQQISALNAKNKGLNSDLEGCFKAISDVNRENQRLTNELEKTKPKPKTTPKPPVTKPINDNPFGTSDGGNGAGTGKGIGNDNGMGDGPGIGSLKGRKIIYIPSTDGIKSKENCRITFEVKVDSSGKLIEVPVLARNQTTNFDKELIEILAQKLYSDLRYSSVPSAEILRTTITLTIKAN